MDIKKTAAGNAPNIKPAKKARPKQKSRPNPKDSVKISGTTPTRYPFLAGNKAEALESSKESMEKISSLISGAKDSVQVEMYRLGHPKIVNLLVNQAKNGVKVQVLLDDSEGYDSADAKKQAEMREHLSSNGVQVLRYPTGKPKNRIDHVKMLIVDNNSLLIGGMNWDKHSPENVDQNIVFQGPIINQAQDVYQNDWIFAGGKPLENLKPAMPVEDANATARMLTTERDCTDISTAIQDNIKNAKKSVYLEAFAIADKATINNLCDASQRGVDVRVILDPNKPIFFVNRKSAQKLKEAGVKVKWYDIDVDRREKLHSKISMFDDDKVIIGSANFTRKGLEVNHEANVEVVSKAMGKAFKNMFLEHWENKSSEETPNIPDFIEKPPEKPPKEQIGRELYRYFTKNYHPDSTRIFAGARKDKVVDAIEKFDKTKDAAPVVSLGKQGEQISENAEMRTIGDLASFFGDCKDMKMFPVFEDGISIYDARVKVSKEKGVNVHKEVPRLMNDMTACIKDKEIAKFVEKAIERCPKGFYQAPSSSTGKHHPADEVDPNLVDLSPNAKLEPYKGGGLVLHSRRVQKMAGKLCDHYGVKGKEKDEILAAAALHDMMKSVDKEEMESAMNEGRDIKWEGHTRPDHGPTVSKWIKMMDESPGKKLTKNISRFCKNHMAVWNEPKESPPSVMGEFIISMSDLIVSQDNLYLEV